MDFFKNIVQSYGGSDMNEWLNDWVTVDDGSLTVVEEA